MTPTVTPRTPAPVFTTEDAIDARLRSLGAETELKSRLSAVLPWIVSIGLHLLGVIVATLVTWAVVSLGATPDATLVVADFRQPGLGPVVSIDARLPDTTGLADASLQLEVPAPRERPSEPLLPGAPAPPTAPAAPALLLPTEGSVSFVGLRATNARKIVYVVDASGSMVGSLPIVLDELARSIRNLQPSQSFAVIFFQRNQAVGVPPGDRLVPALPEERERAIRWMRAAVIPSGRSNPLRALETAIRLRPEVIFLLGHEVTGSGQFEIDQRELLAALDRVNPVQRATGNRRVLIKCIQFLDEDPLQTLRRIADDHGGADGYRFLDRAELGVAPR